MLPRATYNGQGAHYILQNRGPTGRSVSEVYLMHEQLGQGSFGVVRRAVSKLSGKTCALKIISKATAPPEILRRLAEELAIHAQCDHPNIVRMYETFEDDSRVHIALEMCEGGDLETLLEKQGCLSEIDACKILKQVLNALHYLHSVRQIAHRDLKLENLMLSSRTLPLWKNRVKLIDFGFADAFKPHQRTLTQVVGTPSFMAPEIYFSPAYDERCDLWSCGVVFYYMLSGSFPFDGSSLVEILEDASAKPISFDSPPWRNVSVTAKLLLKHLCEPKPHLRFTAEQALASHCFHKNKWEHYQDDSSIENMQVLQQESQNDKLVEESSLKLVAKLPRKARSMQQMCDFQRAVLRLVAYRLDDHVTSDESMLFKHLDQNNDGRLTLDEFTKAFELTETTVDNVKELFHTLDIDGNATIEYSEFLSLLLESQKENLVAAIQDSFRVCDLNNSGKISVSEIADTLLQHNFLSGSKRERYLQSLSQTATTLSQADTDNDGELDMEEFVNMVLSSPSMSQEEFI